jgi:hypothetical protein
MHRFHRVSSSLALVAALAGGSAAVPTPEAHAAAPIGTASPIEIPSAAKPIAPPVAHRLRMKVKMVKPSDLGQGPGNTEDEIYFSLAGVRRKGDSDVALPRRTVRPQISRDFWEMGPMSADDFQATIFQGTLGAQDRASFALLLQEQDNKQAGALAYFFTLASAGLAEALIAAGATHKAGDPGDVGMTKLKSDIDKLLDAMKEDGDELIGGIEITVKSGKLEVRAPQKASAKLIASTNKTATVKLSGAGADYRVELVLEDPSAPAPKTQTYLSREDDDCSQPNLWVEKSGGGNVLVQKGDGGVPVRVKDDVFHWHCGSMSEDDKTNAPDDTKLVEVTRKASGDMIIWDCYHEKTATPQYSW